MKRISSWIALLFIFGTFPSAVWAAADGQKRAVTWQPAKLVRGSPVLFRVSASSRIQAVSGSWFGHDVQFSRSTDAWYGLAGIPVETPPGSYILRLNETSASGKITISTSVRIGVAKYPRISIQVAKRFTEPSAEQLKVIAADKQVKETTFAHETAERLWDGPFLPPVDKPISDVFGTERVFNGQVQSRHLGLDFAAPAGTPVHAINAGKVVLARELYFEGGFIVIDHGQGLLSLYLHLSEFKVHEGDEVTPGQLIALSGGSGRATGPHLHLAVRWQQVYLDPKTLLDLRIPR